MTVRERCFFSLASDDERIARFKREAQVRHSVVLTGGYNLSHTLGR